MEINGGVQSSSSETDCFLVCFLFSLCSFFLDFFIETLTLLGLVPDPKLSAELGLELSHDLDPEEAMADMADLMMGRVK